MKKSLLLLMLAALFGPALNGQIGLDPKVVSSAGGYHEAGNLSISWTLGELAVTTLTGGDMALTQGFQQPFDVGVGIVPDRMNWNISVYPNPVRNELNIRFHLESPGDYLLEVQDVTGRIISQGLHQRVNPGDMVVINTSSYTPGIYFLKVLTPDREQIQVTSLRKL